MQLEKKNRLYICRDGREKWIDVLRSIAILFVLFGHFLEKTDDSFAFFVFTSPIKIPLFFAISGYLFNENKKINVFLKKVLFGLIIPWLSLSILPVLFISLFKGWNYFFYNFWEILIGNQVWYMPCCILAELVFYFTLKCKKDYIRIPIGIALTIVGIIFINFRIADMFMINRALSVQLFLFIGYYIHKYSVIDRLNVGFVFIGAFLYIVLGILSCILFPGMNLDVHRGMYYFYPISFSMIFLGCMLLFVIAKKTEWDALIFVFIGQNTLIYYIWGNYPISIFNIILSKIGFTLIQNNYLIALMKMIFASLVCAILAVFINRFFPELVGKKRKKIA